MLVKAVGEWLRENRCASVHFGLSWIDGVCRRRRPRREKIEFENAGVAPAGEVGERAAVGVGADFGPEEDALGAEVGEDLGPKGAEEHAVRDDGDGERGGGDGTGGGEEREEMLGPKSRRSPGHGVVGFNRNKVSVTGLGDSPTLIGEDIVPCGPGRAFERAEILLAEERGGVDIEFPRRWRR